MVFDVIFKAMLLISKLNRIEIRCLLRLFFSEFPDHFHDVLRGKKIGVVGLKRKDIFLVCDFLKFWRLSFLNNGTEIVHIDILRRGSKLVIGVNKQGVKGKVFFEIDVF
jgi:hypothetical protein